MCRSLNRQYGTDYLSLMPTNLYGPGDNFDLAYQPRAAGADPPFHEAKVAAEAGGAAGPGEASRSGAPARRCASSCTWTTSAAPSPSASTACTPRTSPDGMLNVGCGEDLTIRELAERVRAVVGYEGAVEWDASKPDGTPRKLMDVSRLRGLGWAPSVGLEDGLRRTYQWYLENRA